MDRAQRLASVSRTLPLFISAAYTFYNDLQFAEAIVDGWMVIEQHLDNMWEDIVDTQSNAARDRLRDNRTYTASVRLDILRLEDLLSEDYCV